MPFIASNKRFEVQGPFKRRGQDQYWTVFDKVGKFVVSTHPRSGEAWNKMSHLEDEQKATSTGG